MVVCLGCVIYAAIKYTFAWGVIMGAIQNLTADYKEIYSINLQKDKKVALFINILAFLIVVSMVIIMNFYIPISSLFSMENGLLKYFIKFLVLISSIVSYIYLHELVHGITMKAFGTKKVKYGFTGMYAFAGSNDYYDKKSYITIALTPIIVFLFVFVVINFLVPKEWFWIVYFLQICNISGAAGDIFVTVKLATMPKDIVVKDKGVGITVYSKQ